LEELTPIRRLQDAHERREQLPIYVEASIFAPEMKNKGEEKGGAR
jgi:hypothetical protein